MPSGKQTTGTKTPYKLLELQLCTINMLATQQLSM